MSKTDKLVFSLKVLIAALSSLAFFALVCGEEICWIGVVFAGFVVVGGFADWYERTRGFPTNEAQQETPKQSRGKPKQRRQRRDRIPKEVRQAVHARDGGCCQRCGSTMNLEFDHIVPVAKGGSNSKENVELLCRRCNRSKSDKIE